MNPIIRVLGKVLRLVGISSPEDNLPKQKDLGGPPSWRDRTASSEPLQDTPKK